MTTSAQMAERMKAEILGDVRNGIIPKTVAGYSDLHDYVDANCYGGTETLLDELDQGVPETDEARQAVWDALYNVMKPAMDIVDAWIKDGGIRDDQTDSNPN